MEISIKGHYTMEKDKDLEHWQNIKAIVLTYTAENGEMIGSTAQVH